MDSNNNTSKSKKQEYNFRPDAVFKYLFTNLSNKTRIKLLNSIFKIDLKDDTEIEIINTENVLSNIIDKKLEDMRSDIILDADYKRKIHLEFQSTKDNSMGLRVFLYGLELAKSEQNKDENIIRFPLSHVLYTVLYGKPMYGEDSIILDIPNCTIENKYYEDCRIKISIKYTNLLSFSLEDFSNKNLEVLSFVYLYRYIKNTDKCKKDEDIKRILNEIDIISKILNTVPKIDREKLIIPVTNIIQDVSDIATKNVKSKEMISMLKEKVKSYAETIRDEAIEKGLEKGLEKGRIEIARNMLKDNEAIEKIIKYTGLSKEEILSLK